MNTHRGLETIGAEVIDGRKVEFLAGDGVNFVTAQFVDANPRGIANLVDLHRTEPRVVPLSHASWIAKADREQKLIDAARKILGIGQGHKGMGARGAKKDDHPPQNASADLQHLLNRHRPEPAQTR